MATLDTQSLVAVIGHDNVFNLQASVDDLPQDLTGKTMTAKVDYVGAGAPLALSIGSGLAFTSAALGKIALTLTIAQIAAMSATDPINIYLTIWNADNSQWGHGSFAATVELG